MTRVKAAVVAGARSCGDDVSREMEDTMGGAHTPEATSSPHQVASPGTPLTAVRADDRLAAVIAADPAVVDRLVALDRWFEMLKSTGTPQPIDELATVAMAAAAAGVPVAAVLAAINAGRASPCCAGGADAGQGETAEEEPSWFADLDADAAARVDVRPLLASHQEPFATILRAANAVPLQGALVIEAPFNPRPLRRLLAGRGFVTFGQRIGASHWRIWCRRALAENAPGEGQGDGKRAPARTWRIDDAVHIDVRGLEAPAPLTAILSLIDGGDHQGRIVVHHHRDPLYLYAELDERGWQYTRLPSPAGEVCLDLRRSG
ncbi:MAG: DUF2249 domain-containing protein [Rhodospirillales bacterium]|nr:DUF2249 domain-containing protein [Rhodospirillales bacterium]